MNCVDDKFIEMLCVNVERGRDNCVYFTAVTQTVQV